MKLPKARSKNIVVQHLDDETLIYDLVTNQAFCLNETASKVFNACDGKRDFDDLKRQYRFTDDLIYLTLNELKDKNLLENYQSNHFGGLSRREVIKKVGLASAVALPVIAAMMAPTAAHAASVACTPGQTSDPAGLQGQGDNCTCTNNGSNGLMACNTTRGGNGTVAQFGCKTGCRCFVADPATACSSGICGGICG